MPDNRPQIKPNPPRWKPSPDPASIDIPGLDTGASTNDQINQIDQLITLKLQNIDENFSKTHSILSNRILPAVKRYGATTEPVRNAAQFWRSFYEQAAQIRIPTSDDYSTVNDQPSERTEETVRQPESSQCSVVYQQDSRREEQQFDHSIASDESSFMPSNAISSTPAVQRTLHTFDQTPDDSQPAWSASLESPLVRLDRELKHFSIDDDEPSAVQNAPTLHNDQPPSSPSNESSRILKGKGREQPEPLLRSVLQKNVYSREDTFTKASPSKSRKVKTPIPASMNPYLPENTAPSQWNGVVDLRDPSVMTPHHGYRVPRRPTTPIQDDDDDDDLFALPAGMSPPRLYSPAMPKSVRKPALGRTPNREIAARITDSLVSGFQQYPRDYRGYGTESSMSSVPSPPSVSRYAKGSDTSSSVVGESSMESMLRRVGVATTPALRLRPKSKTPISQQYPIVPGFATDTYGEPVLGTYRTPQGQELDDEDYSFEDDEVNNTAHPSAAFNLLASVSRGSGEDDSFESSNNSFGSMDGDIDVGEPFEGFADDYNDTMDDDSFGDMDDGVSQEEETLFGVPPAQRHCNVQQGMVLHGEQLFGDMGMTEQLENVADSPTPWPRR